MVSTPAPAVTAATPAERSEDGPPSAAERLQESLSLRKAGVGYALVLVVAVLAVLSEVQGRPPYLAAANVANVLEQTSFYAILAVAMAVLLISGSFDLSVGSLTALCAAVCALATGFTTVPLAILAALAVGVAGGLVNGLIHWKVGVNPFIVTLGTLTAFRGLTLIVSDSRTVTVATPEAREQLVQVGSGYVLTADLVLAVGAALVVAAAVGLARRRDRWPLWAGVAVAGVAVAVLSVEFTYALRLAKPVYYLAVFAAIVWLTMRYTVTGRRLYATGGNLEAAKVAGVAVGRYKVVPFAFVGLAAGIAGVLFTARLGAVDPNAFTGGELIVLAAAIVGGVALYGGKGDVGKTVVGAILLFTITNGFNILNVGAEFQQLFTGAVVVFAASVYVVAERRKAAGAGR